MFHRSSTGVVAHADVACHAVAPDASFGDGRLLLDLALSNANGMALDADGRIVVVGKTENGLVRRVGIIRVLP
jgi:sugar lactone lactonase YvrE